MLQHSLPDGAVGEGLGVQRAEGKKASRVVDNLRPVLETRPENKSIIKRSCVVRLDRKGLEQRVMSH